MPAPNPIHAIGIILSPTSDRTYRTALPNGKEIIAHLSRRNAEALGPLAAQTRVHLEMTSYDFNIGRISGPVAGQSHDSKASPEKSAKKSFHVA